jgi:hypothetical protein
MDGVLDLVLIAALVKWVVIVIIAGLGAVAAALALGGDHML